jgi:type II secretion system protein C
MEFRLDERHIVGINFALIAAIAFLAARAVNQFIAQEMVTVSAPAVRGGLRHSDAARGRAYYDVIVKRDVFNLVPQAKAPEPALTAMDLHLKLLGTSTALKHGPWAIIENQSGDESLYHLEEDIPDAGELIAVEKNRVIIRHGAQRVALEIPQDSMPGGVQGPAHPAVRPAFRGFGAVPGLAGKQVKGPMPDIDVEDEGPNKYGVKRSDVRAALAHASELITQIKASPNMNGSTQTGYQLSDIQDGSVFDDLGLEDGDVLTQINGRPVNNPAVAAGMIATMQMRPTIDVTVLRDGHPVDLHYDIR